MTHFLHDVINEDSFMSLHFRHIMYTAKHQNRYRTCGDNCLKHVNKYCPLLKVYFPRNVCEQYVQHLYIGTQFIGTQ